jgi:hypothetical protein
MATTYEPIATTTLATTTASVTFSAISGSYTDLILAFDGLSTAGSDAVGFQIKVNGADGSLQSYTRLQGNGTTAASTRVADGDPAVGVIGNSERTNIIAHIMNYSNATTFKTILSRFNTLDSGDGRTGAYVNLTRSTNAVTSLLIDLSTGSFASGSTFSLYGIASA